MRLPIILVLTAILHAGIVQAAAPAPIGVWKTVDDDTHQVKALVEISENDGVLSGRVTRLFRNPDQDQDPRCEPCQGERHTQRVLGMTILWNLRRDGDEWDGGEILDPEEGKVYRCKLHPIEGGTKLEVRGYIGISLLGRTQIWERATP